MRNLKRAAAVTIAASGLAMAGAGIAAAHGGAAAGGQAAGSPGIGSGNLVQVPVHVPVNACGNTVTVVGALNPAFGNLCLNR
ncbi:chaplin [Streptomyces aculeolatus]|uniref:chaplin n=1 Tax=Streptomyces aculeolatus TaxID=270689 RepID=UPI0005606E1C|nr:chaplin [Streptomyces aculeolatus]